jgi:D-3-phosphoglycerate dehydrogenase / 2-oxoglutarate reductase
MPPNFGIGQVLHGRTWASGATARSASMVAGYGRAFGMQVQVWGSESAARGRWPTATRPPRHCEAFFESSDVLSLHLRLNEQTRGIVRLEDLSRMKPTRCSSTPRAPSWCRRTRSSRR